MRVHNVFRVLMRDLKRIAKAPASWVVILVLIALPSLYTWFNVVGFWNPYNNTGALKVCVVNEDEARTTTCLAICSWATKSWISCTKIRS